ncbi:hypothetical protein AbraIFM66951_005959, partial [Aspergillus brasiliensis]
MSTHQSASHTTTRHTAGVMNDGDKRSPQGRLCAPPSIPLDISEADNSFDPVARPPYHRAQTQIDLSYQTDPRLSQLPRQPQLHGEGRYNLPPDPENYVFAEAGQLQPCAAPQDYPYR